MQAEPEKKENPPEISADEASSTQSRDIEKADSHPVPTAQDHDRQTHNDGILEQWDGPTDSQNPVNWPLSKKYTTTVLYSTMTFCITFASSVFSTATFVTAKEFGVSNEVMILGTSLFVLVSPSSVSCIYIIALLTQSVSRDSL